MPSPSLRRFRLASSRARASRLNSPRGSLRISLLRPPPTLSFGTSHTASSRPASRSLPSRLPDSRSRSLPLSLPAIKSLPTSLPGSLGSLPWCLSRSGSLSPPLRSLCSPRAGRSSSGGTRLTPRGLSSSGAPRFCLSSSRGARLASRVRSAPGGLLELRRLWRPECSRRPPLRSQSRSSLGSTAPPIMRSSRSEFIASLAGSGRPAGGGGGGCEMMGVPGAELGVSGCMPELILAAPRPLTFIRSGAFC